METTVIIRDRFQLTIPEAVRGCLDWLAPGLAVKLSLQNNSLVLEPYRRGAVSWEEIWKVVKSAVKKGKKTSLADFIVSDRGSH